MKTTTERALTAAHNEYQRTLTSILIKEAARAHIAGDLNAHKLLDIGISFDLVQKEALEYSKDYGKLLYREGASIIKGKKIPWLKEHGAHTREGVFKTIRDGLKEGKPVSEIAGKKLGKGTIAYDLKQIMKAEDSSMVRIARTEVARIQSAGSMTRYKVNNVKKIKILCAADPCEICTPYCNQIMAFDEAPEIPIHPNCRCSYAPVIER